MITVKEMANISLMKTKKRSKPNIKIDASLHRPAPNFVQRLKYTFLSAFYGIVAFQIVIIPVVFILRKGTMLIYYYFDEPLFWAYLAVCIFFGWRRGEDFVYWIREKIDSVLPW